MAKLLIASNNAGKIREFKAILAPLYDQVLSMREAGIALEVEETGTTFAENALLKARALAQLCSCDVLSDDSGIEVDALGGRPGVYSARYSAQGTDEANNAKLLQELQGVCDEKRTARYACVVALVRADGSEVLGHGTCEGMINHAPAGENGFGYDPYFYLPQYGMTMAQLDPAEKNRISHRAAALRDLLTHL